MDRRGFFKRSGAVVIGGAPWLVNRAAGARGADERPVRIAMFGTQHAHAAGKLEAIGNLPKQFELVGVYEPDTNRRGALASSKKYHGVRWLTEKDIFVPGAVEAVAVETAVRDLVPAAHRCVEAGLHVHLDKPAGESLADFARLAATAKQRSIQVQMGYMLRHNPAFEFCFRAVREGWLGPIVDVDGSMSKLVDNEKRAQLAEYAGGAMFELGSHLIDALVIVLGEPTKVTPIGRTSRPRGDGYVDEQLAVCEYPSAIATIRSSVVNPFGQPRRHFTVRGENGVIDIRPLEPPQATIALVKPAGGYKSGEHRVVLPPSAGRYEGQLSELADIIRGRKTTRFTGEHDLAVHRTILRASNLPIGD